MFLLFIGKEVYMGYSLLELSNVRECLTVEKIKYDYKVVSHSSHNRGRFGSLGSNINYEKQYYVYVKRGDYKKAKYLVDNALHRLWIAIIALFA